MMQSTTRIADALVAAAEWRLLGLLLERPRPGWADEVRALAAEVADGTVRAAATRGADEGGEGRYLALLGPGGLASPREAAYLGLRDPGWALADLARYYDAFAFAPRREDPADHLAVEVGFVAYLHLKEAFAIETGDEEAAAVTAAARERFVAEHVARLAHPLAERLAPAGDTPLATAVRLLARRLPPPPPGTAGAGSDEDGPPTCGACVGSAT
jgi:nitrate reductase assembly molybdenum cofactor insertion protein NarJ